MKIIACTESNADRIERYSLEMITAALSVASPDDEVVAFIAGTSPDAAIRSLGAAGSLRAAVTSAAEVLPAEIYGRNLLALVDEVEPELVLVPYSANGLDVSSWLSARTGWPMVSYVSKISRNDDGLNVTAQMYGGKMQAECQVTLPAILMINPGAYAEAPASAVDEAKVQIVDIAADLANSRVDVLSVSLPDLSEVDLASCEKIVCVGRGIGDAASIKQARILADLLDAEIAGSRPVVDNGWLPKQRQVGKSGQRVKPKLYLALGVSGAPEHLEGMAKSDLIVAINTDPMAPIFNVAHYYATCDLFDVIASLTERLQVKVGH